MRSPFAIFRKYQKTAMVVLTILAVFAFVVLDSLSQMQGRLPTAMLILLIAPVVAGVGWLVGLRSGNGKEFAIIGAALGVAGGLLFDRISTPAPAVTTGVESISGQELNEMINRRNLANRFLGEAMRRAIGDDRMLGFWSRNWLFSYGGPDQEYDVSVGRLYGYEADSLDIQVPDTSVSDYINQATQNKLTADDFREIRGEMRLSEAELYDIIREQLRARRAQLLLYPRIIATPEQYWQLYRKLHVREALDVAAVPVEQFESQVAEPSSAELMAYFETYKSVAPQIGMIRPEPAFMQPRKVRIAYLEADYETTAQTVAAVTDAEVEAFYEQNKFLYRNNPPMETEEPAAETESDPLDPEFSPEPTSETDAEPAESPDAPNAPAESAAPTEPDAPAEDAPQDDPTDSQDNTITDSGLETEGADEAAADSGSANPQPVEAPRPDDSDSAGSNSDSANSNSDSDSPADTADESMDADVEPLPEFQPLDDELREEIRDQLLNERAQKAMRALIEEATEVMFRLSDQYNDFQMESLAAAEGEQTPDETKKFDPAPLEQELRSFADQKGLRYVDTGLVSEEELMDPNAPEELAIGLATRPVDSDFDRANAPDVITQLFRERGLQLYAPRPAENFGASKQFAFWKTDDVEARVPSFDEPGIQDEVLAAWKRKEARPLAKARAEELAEIVRGGTQGLADALGGKTATGDGEPLTIIETEQFSWLRVPAAPQLNIFSQPPPPERSQISGVEYPNEEFMNTIFNELGEGEVGVVTNVNQSAYYVVMVKNRNPSTEGGEEAMRQSFLREDLFSNQFIGASPYALVMGTEQGEAQRRWQDAVLEMYALRITPPEPAPPQ